MFRVTTPQPGYTGVSVGVQFIDGVGECPDGPALRYFRSQGYGVEPVPSAPQPKPEPETPAKSGPRARRNS